MDHHHDRMAGLRERAAVSLLRTTADLALQRQEMVDRIAGERAGVSRDKALADLVPGAWTESALMWLAWRLLPGRSLVGPTF